MEASPRSLFTPDLLVGLTVRSGTMKPQQDTGINVISTNPFSHQQEAAFALAGTVALPSPPPASGPLSLGCNAGRRNSANPVIPRFYLKSVQRVSDRQLINRIFDLEELRAVSLPGSDDCGREPPRRILVADDDEVACRIASATGQLEEAAAKQGPNRNFEVELFACAVAYIRESTPVLTQIQYEYGVTAAESSENVCYLEGMAGFNPCVC